MRFDQLVRTSAEVAATRSRRLKVERLHELLAGATPADLELAVAYLCGEVPGGALGIGPALLREVRGVPPAPASELTLAELQRALRAVAGESGPGSRGRRRDGLVALLGRVDADGQRFLARLLVGELRQGALDGIMAEAIASVAGVPADAVRRAWMLSGELPVVARAAGEQGEEGLRRYRLELFRPVHPMLAGTAEDPADALGRLAEHGAFEYKLDGARVQVHKAGDEVRVFTRGLNEVTVSVPEVVEAVRSLGPRELVLDGEVLALEADGRPRPFQQTMRRFGRRKDVAAARARLPLTVFFFDVLLAEGRELFDEPLEARHAALRADVPDELLVPRLVTADPAQADAFLAQALERGHEGIMAKDTRAPYEAGSRGRAWLKVKRVHTLDLVVLAVERGSGRREGTLSNLHLGARGEGGGFVMLGKTFKGLSDELLRWQTEALSALAVGTEGHVVHVRPELVVEIAFDELQESAQYPGGLALRFARVKRYRPDKSAAEADTMATVRALHEADRARGRRPRRRPPA